MKIHQGTTSFTEAFSRYPAKKLAERHSSPNQPPEGWVLYDSSCDFCSFWASILERFLNRQGFQTTDLQTPWVKNLIGNREELLNHFRILTSTGDLYCGPDAYRYILSNVWWLSPVYLFSILPGGRQIFNFAYRLFDQNRYRISRAWQVVTAK